MSRLDNPSGGGGSGTPSDTVAALDGAGAAGAATAYSRGDHKHGDGNRPTDGQKAGLAGTSGTPGDTNRFVTDGDARNTNARTPTAHASTHQSGGGDAISAEALAPQVARSAEAVDPDPGAPANGRIWYNATAGRLKAAIAGATRILNDWNDLFNKPATFPPSTHTHLEADITDFAHGDSQHDATVASLDGGGKIPTSELGSGTPSSSTFLRGDQQWAAPPGGGASPGYYTKIAAAYGQGDPGELLRMMQRGTIISPTPTNISTSVARCCFFRLPFDLTVNKIRFYGVGATTGIYRVAIYRYSTLARLAVVNDFNTSANAWGAAGSALGLALLAGVLYFIAVAVDTTGTTAGILAMGTTIAAATGQIQTAPQSLPGNLDADADFINGYEFQFAVTSGALPDPAATLAAQAAWTGGMPAFFLDNSDA